jgi:hypothetical protein
MYTVTQLKQRKLAQRYRELLKQEAIIGGKLFGPLGPGHKREFVCLDERTWIWHEEWVDSSGLRRVQTTRYDVRPHGVIKCVNDGTSKIVSQQEAKNLLQASKLYSQRIAFEIYQTAAAL